MPPLRPSGRLFWCVTGLTLAGVVMAGEEPREWLERMNQALISRNYDGVFSHWQGGHVEMLRIIHRLQDGEITERLVSLDSSGREFIRSGGELACYLPDQRTVVVEKRPPGRPLFGNFPSFDETSGGVYDVKEVKRTRFNRRNTRLIAVAPLDNFRYGYRLWIDESTAMPLKTQLCDRRGRVLEQVVFASLTLSSRIPNTAFKPDVSTQGFQWVRNEHEPIRSEAVQSIAWSANKLPPGFHILDRSAQLMPGATNPVGHLVFTDGLASVSVFVELQPVPPSLKGQVQGVVATQFGSSSAFSTVVDGHKVTAMGEVPLATVQFIATSLQPASAGHLPVPGR